MFKRIIVPLDGSSRAEHALPVAARIARASGGAIHFLQVLTPMVDYGGLAPVPMVTEQSAKTEMDEATHYLTNLAMLPMLKGIPITTEVIFGMPARQILAVAESQGTNLIVLCSHGRTGFTRWAMGSVTHQLVHQTSVPVLVLREHEATSLVSRGGDAQSFRTLVPLDGSELAESALWPAAYLTSALSTPGHGALHLVQVVKVFPATAEEGYISELNEEALQRARTYMATLMEHIQTTMKDLNLSLTYAVEYERDVTSTLTNVAEYKGERKEAEGSKGCDLIAISTHGRGGLQRLIMGSVTDRLLNTTTRPMLVVRPHKVSRLWNEEKHALKQKSSDPEAAHTEASWVGLL